MADNVVVLVNPNRIRPPIAPLGLEYLASAVESCGFRVVVADLTFAGDPDAFLAQTVETSRPLAVGVSLRNLDDCYMTSGDYFVTDVERAVRLIRAHTTAPVVLGGSGFSIAPGPVLAATGADYGIVGDGEGGFCGLLSALRSGGDVRSVGGLVWRASGRVIVNDPAPVDMAAFPRQERSHLDNVRYFAEGGQGGVETKRGCDGRCIYCVDAHTKGRRLRLRRPAAVVDEIEALLRQGVDVLHICDSEFNRPYDHAMAVCEEIARRDLPVRWYTYASPRPFDARLADAMAAAGCVGVNFGADSGDDGLLRRLGRDHTSADVATVARACKAAGMSVMFDLLVGGPGETMDSLARTIEVVVSCAADVVGVNIGARVYPGTALAEFVLSEGPVSQNPNLRGNVAGNDDLLMPVFYVSPDLGDDPLDAVVRLTCGDGRFLLPVPAGDREGYNYNDNTPLEEAIRAGARGAYWDIIRRMG